MHFGLHFFMFIYDSLVQSINLKLQSFWKILLFIKYSVYLEQLRPHHILFF